MTDRQSPTKRKLVTKTAGPVDKRHRPRGLTRTVKVAIDAMVFDRCTRAEACEKAGFTERAMYLALEKAEVAAYWNRQVQVLRAGERAANIHRLVEIRDKAENMPAVQAIKTMLEQDAEAVAHPTSNASPWVTIVIQDRDAERVTINAAPAEPSSLDAFGDDIVPARPIPIPFAAAVIPPREPEPEAPPAGDPLRLLPRTLRRRW